MRPITFEGTTVECLRYLNEQARVSNVSSQISEFVSCSKSGSAESWLKGKYLPIGLHLAKLRFFLEMVGFKVAELESMDRVLYLFSKLLSFGIISSVEEAEKLISVGRNTVMRIILGKFSTGATNKKIIRVFAREHVDDLDSAIKAQLRKMGLSDDYRKSTKEMILAMTEEIKQTTVFKETENVSDDSRVEQDNSLVSVKAVSSEKDHNTPKNVVINVLATLIKAAVPLAEALTGDDYSPEDRAVLRGLCNRDGVFRLNNSLTALCGERAREHQQTNGRQP